MKNIVSIIALIAMPMAIGTVLEPNLEFNDLILKQQAETKALNDRLNKKYEAALAKKDLLDRSGEYENATKLLYERYRKEAGAGPSTIEQDLELLREKFSPGLNASLKSYNEELSLGNKNIANKYSQMRKAIGQR